MYVNIYFVACFRRFQRRSSVFSAIDVPPNVTAITFCMRLTFRHQRDFDRVGPVVVGRRAVIGAELFVS